MVTLVFGFLLKNFSVDDGIPMPRPTIYPARTFALDRLRCRFQRTLYLYRTLPPFLGPVRTPGLRHRPSRAPITQS